MMTLSKQATTKKGMLPVTHIYIIEDMKNDNLYDDLKEVNPVQYYLKHIGNIKIMAELLKEDRELYNYIHRLDYIRSFRSTEPLHRCPSCKSDITQDEWGEEYCPKCGEVTRGTYPYVAGLPFKFKYGLKL